MEKIYIYGLVDPETNLIRYIGRTRCPSQRLWEHHQPNRLKGQTHKNKWILSLLYKGLKARMVILEECDQMTWSEKEREWIETVPNLTNTTRGGEGEYKRHLERKPLPEDVRRKIGKKISEINRSPEAKPKYEKLSKTVQGVKKGCSDNPSRFCGVYKTKNGTFLSYITVRNKRTYLGNYQKEEDAALAYDIEVRKLYGETAKFNFPDIAGQASPPQKTRDLFSSKYKGVNFQGGRWAATVFIDGKKKYLGSFATEEEAFTAREKFLKKGID